MKALPTHGVFSNHTLMLHEDVNREPMEMFLKRSAILFERLVLIPFGIGPMGQPGELISKNFFLGRKLTCTAEQLKEVSGLVLLDKDIVGCTERFHATLHEWEADDLWTGERGERFTDFVTEYVDSVYADESVRERWEMKKYFIGNLNLDHKLLKIINRDFGECTGLLTELHEMAVKATFGDTLGNPNSVSQTIANLNSCGRRREHRMDPAV